MPGLPPPSIAAKPGGNPPSIPSAPARPSAPGGGIPPINCCSIFIIGSSSPCCCPLSLPGGGAPLRRRARMSASAGLALFAFEVGYALGVRAAEGWVDRSTSSGSACRLEEEGEAAGGVKSC